MNRTTTCPGKEIPKFVQQDPYLLVHSSAIQKRNQNLQEKERELTGGKAPLADLATGHLFYGLHRTTNGWVFREWLPNAKSVYLLGDWNQWKEHPDYALKRKSHGNWELKLPEEALRHGDQFRLLVKWEGGSGTRVPAWSQRVIQDPQYLHFNAQVWHPENPYQWKVPDFRVNFSHPMIYEAHIGMATEKYGVGTYAEFREQVLPRIKAAGYNTIQLMAIQEHPYYGSFGYHVSSFFAPSSRFGPPEDLKELIDAAHSMGIAVIMDLVHSHAVKNVEEGLGWLDGSPGQYFHTDERREHPAWDSLCFNYGKREVLHFLLSNCRYWLEEFHFDGFRFDGVTSMLYKHHGLGQDFSSYDMYFNGHEDGEAITYLGLANKLIHELRPDALSIAEEMSGMPGLCVSVDEGGMGFDFRLAMGTPDFWIKLIKEVSDERWDVGQIYYELTNKRPEEKTIGYAESHDQALVGDKTIIFRLMDQEMYTHMSKDHKSLIVDRGMALHKMIRLITFACNGGGYLNFMGNEFGHPEWIDFPRKGNNWSYHYARRQWSLADNPFLRYHHLKDFDEAMLRNLGEVSEFWNHQPHCIHSNKKDQILAFTRGDYLFVFNFHPTRSFSDYRVMMQPGKFQVLFHTDSDSFGGFDRVDETYIYYTSTQEGKVEKNQALRLYLPCRTALVLKRRNVRSVY